MLEWADPELRATVVSLLARPAREGRQSLLKHAGSLQSETTVNVGVKLGLYRIEQEIGRGGMGAVYRAADTRLGRSVAIRISRSLFDERFERKPAPSLH